MEKKSFNSQLFRRQINAHEPDYWPIVHAETLYRIKDLEIKKCSCFKCMQDLDRLNEYLNKLMSHPPVPINKKPVTVASGSAKNTSSRMASR